MRYSAEAHLYCSARPSVFSNILLDDDFKHFYFENSIKRFMCGVVVEASGLNITLILNYSLVAYHYSPTTSLTGKASLIRPRPPSSGTTGPEAISSLVLLYIYWIDKWYISVLPKIDQLTFSAGPPFFPVPYNHPLTGFNMGRKMKPACDVCPGPPPTQCGTSGTPIRDAEVYQGDITMVRMC